MSSPLAKSKKTRLDKALVASHRTLSHDHRIACLVGLMGNRIRELGLQAPVRVLDVGCGDMTLAKGLAQYIEGIQLTCVDIYPPPLQPTPGDDIWATYRQFDGRSLPFEDGSFDVVIFSDVLHHVPSECLHPLLASAARVGQFVLVKDHFEYGWWSRQLLRAMDFVGNYGYGVSVPRQYFSQESFAQTLRAAGLHQETEQIGIRLYDHLPVLRSVLSPRWQFLATCRGAEGNAQPAELQVPVQAQTPTSSPRRPA
ncbi:MAG: class I SAM-dependent methyltransferase [Rubrivivax sp.]